MTFMVIACSEKLLELSAINMLSAKIHLKKLPILYDVLTQLFSIVMGSMPLFREIILFAG